MNEKTCRTCEENDDGLCDRLGILVEEDDTCEKHRDHKDPAAAGDSPEKERKKKRDNGKICPKKRC